MVFIDLDPTCMHFATNTRVQLVCYCYPNKLDAATETKVDLSFKHVQHVRPGSEPHMPENVGQQRAIQSNTV